MKKYFLSLTLIFVMLLTLVGCINFNIGNEVITGNGKKETHEIALENQLTGVRTLGAIDVILDPQIDGKYILEGDSNILDRITVEQRSDGVLELGFNQNISITSFSNVKVYVPYIKGGLLETASVGSISLKGDEPLRGDRFDLRISSTGNIELVIKTIELKANASSTGKIKISGNANKAEIILSSTGAFEGYEFNSADAIVYVYSTGSAYVNVVGELDVTISGTGNVIYDGIPESIVVRGGGPGTVKPR